MPKFITTFIENKLVLVNLDRVQYVRQESGKTRLVFGVGMYIDIDGGIEDFVEMLEEAEIESGSEAYDGETG